MITKFLFMIRVLLSSMVAFLALFSCGKGPKEVPQKKLIGINGEAVYLFDQKGKIKSLFKEQFNNHDFVIFLLRDTVMLGDNFKSLMRVTDPDYKIEITSPSDKVMSSESNNSDFRTYEFTPEREGVYDFTGIIKYDTLSTPFDYKFIVVKKD